MNYKLFNRNFIFVILGQSISMFGTAILRFTLSLYILDLTGSATVFGMITAISMIPTILISPFGGIVADRMNKRNIMVVLDLSYSLIAFALFAMLLINKTVIILAVVMILLSVISSFEAPVVQSSIPLLQKNDNLIRANSVVNQIAMVANMIGPVLAGLLYAMFSAGHVILVSGICFFLAAVLEVFIYIPYEKSKQKQKLTDIVSGDLKESIKYMVKKEPSILKAMLIIASLNLFLSSMLSIGLPYIIRIVLGMSSNLYGITEGAMAMAGLAGGILSAVLASKINVSKVYIFMILAGACLFPIGIGRVLTINNMTEYLIITVCCILIQMLSCILSIYMVTAIQKKTPSRLMGRTMAYVAMLSTCAQPVGQAIYGLLFDVLASKIFIIIFVTAVVTILISIVSKNIFCKLVVEEVQLEKLDTAL